jgi:hypothetical protein
VIVIIPLIIIIGIVCWLLWPGKNPPVQRRNALLLTVIPALVVAIAAVTIQLLHNTTGTAEVAEISNTLFVIGLGLIGAYILALVGFAAARKMDITKGIAFGACIAVIISIIDLGLLEWLGGV